MVILIEIFSFTFSLRFFYLTDSICIFYEPIIECSLTAHLICPFPIHSFIHSLALLFYIFFQKMNGMLSHSIVQVPSSDEMMVTSSGTALLECHGEFDSIARSLLKL
jgi:hypothetical protein